MHTRRVLCGRSFWFVGSCTRHARKIKNQPQINTGCLLKILLVYEDDEMLLGVWFIFSAIASELGIRTGYVNLDLESITHVQV